MFKTQLETDFSAANRIMRECTQIPNVPIEILDIMRNLLQAKEKEEKFKRASECFGAYNQRVGNNGYISGGSTPFIKKYGQYSNNNNNSNNNYTQIRGGNNGFRQNVSQNSYAGSMTPGGSGYRNNIRNPFAQRRNSDAFSSNHQQESYGDIDYSKTGLHDLDIDEFNKPDSSVFQDIEFGSTQNKSSISKSSYGGQARNNNNSNSQGSGGSFQRSNSNGFRSQYGNENREVGYPKNTIRRDSSQVFQERMIQERRESFNGLNKSFNNGSYQSK